MIKIGADAKAAVKGIDGFEKYVDKKMSKIAAVNAKVGDTFGARLLKGAMPGFQAVSKLMLGATAIGGIASAAGSAAGAIVPLTTAVIGLGAALPAFAAGGAAAIGTVQIAFAGMGEAIAGDEEALAGLTPAAQSVVGALQDMEPAWSAVTDAVQERMWVGLSDDLTALGTAVLPRLETGLGGVADGLNDIAAEAIAAAGSTTFTDGLDAALANTEGGMEAFASGVGPLMEGVGATIGAFSPLLTDAGEAAGGLAERFGEWALHMQETGQFAELIDSMKSTFSTLGGIVSNVAGTLSTIFSAATITGGSFLDTLETVTGQINEFLTTAEGQDALMGLFQGLADLGGAVAPIVLALVDALGTGLAPIIGDIATTVGPSLANVATELGNALGEIDIVPLAKAFADLLDIIAPLLVPIGQLLNLILKLSPVIVPLAIALGIWTLAQWAINIALLANPIILIITAIVALIAAIVWVATQTTFFQDVWEAVWGAIKAAAQAVADWWTGTVVPAFQAGMVVLKSAISGAKDWIVDKFNAVVSFFKGLPDRISSAVSGMWDGIKEGFKSAVNAVISGWNNLSFTIPSVDLGPLGEVGGFTLSTPNIPMLANGAIATGPTLAVIGEGRYDEAVVPLPKGAKDFAANAGGRGGAGGGQTELVIDLRGDKELVALFRRAIKSRGGNVQKVLGSA